MDGHAFLVVHSFRCMSGRKKFFFYEIVITLSNYSCILELSLKMSAMLSLPKICCYFVFNSLITHHYKPL